jgi:hypothetical protein
MRGREAYEEKRDFTPLAIYTPTRRHNHRAHRIRNQPLFSSYSHLNFLTHHHFLCPTLWSQGREQRTTSIILVYFNRLQKTSRSNSPDFDVQPCICLFDTAQSSRRRHNSSIFILYLNVHCSLCLFKALDSLHYFILCVRACC